MSLVKNGVISSTDQKVGPAYYENYERIFGKRRVGGPSTGKLKRKDKPMLLDYSGGSVSRMMGDKTLIRHIRGGNANDPGVKREALLIEKENRDNRISKFREGQYRKLEEAKRELRKSGGFAQ